MARHFDEIARDRAQRLIEAERHVPGLRREDRKYRGTFGTKLAARKQAQEEHHRKGEKSEHRHRLQNIDRRDDHQFGLAALGRQRADHDREDERREDRGKHAQGREQRITGQLRRIERYGRDVEPTERPTHPARPIGKRHEAGGDDDENDDIEEVRQKAAPAYAKGGGRPRSFGKVHNSPLYHAEDDTAVSRESSACPDR